MRNRRSTWLFLVLFLTLSVIVAGCGGDDGENGDMDGNADDAPFISSGAIHGQFDGAKEALTLEYDETFAGLLGDTEIAATFDEATDTFIGRIRNEASEAVCDVRIAVVLDPDMGSETVLDIPLVSGLRAGERSNFEFQVDGTSFSEWTVQVETFTCASAPAGGASGEGSEAGGEGSGGEHGAGGEGAEGSEGGSEGGGESGDEASPPISIDDPYADTIGGQAFEFAYETGTRLFRGTVRNTSAGLICDSRTEIHLGTPMGVIELGPTIPEDLEPGDELNVVMYQDGPDPDTYILHPEASPCQ
ncbi:MAG: hypothetical protein OXE40_00260 [Gammaproteobacteria bacterium]|nr:hypothetical protein [Gammaproteobacteria bacterium]